MSSKNKYEKNVFFCPECGMSISHKRIINDSKVSLKYLFCPECGKKIEFAKYMKEFSDNFKYTDKNEIEDELDNALDTIINDRDFSQEFKNIFRHFITRLSYVKMKAYEKEKKTLISQMLLTTELIDIIEDQLSPIMIKNPMLNILKYLDDLFYEKFLLNLKRFQTKVRKKKKYRKAYSIYVRWLIRIVYRVINQINIEMDLYEYQKTIRDDLVKYFEKEKKYDDKMREKKQNGDRKRFFSLMNNYNHLLENDGYHMTFEHFNELIKHDARYYKLSRLNENMYRDCLDKWYWKIYDKSFSDYISDSNLVPYNDCSNSEYSVPEIRVKIKKEILIKIWNILSQLGMSLDEISTYIGTNFKSLRIGGHSIASITYQLLDQLLLEKIGDVKMLEIFNDSTIPKYFTIGKTGKKLKVLENTDFVNEFLAIMQGDGSLLTNGQTFSITLNSEDEARYVIYVRCLLRRIFPKALIHENKDEEGKGITFIINDMSYHYAIVSRGLVPGDKVLNQIRVPRYVILFRIFLTSWLKGLFDTDGSIYLRTGGMGISLSFSSGSKPLVEDFMKICSLIGIDTASEIGIGQYDKQNDSDNSIVFSVYIHAKKEVRKFFRLVNPEKFKEPSRRLYLACKLLIRNFPEELRDNIRREIKAKYPDKYDRRYSKRYALFLKALIQRSIESYYDFHYKITNDLINNTLKRSLKDYYVLNKIAISGGNVVKFPSELRNKLSLLICLIFEKNECLSSTEILSIAKDHLNKSSQDSFLDLYDLLVDQIFNSYIKEYLLLLIELNKALFSQFQTKDLHLYTLARDFDLDPKIVISIAIYLRKKLFIDYPEPIVKEQPNLTNTDKYKLNKNEVDSFVKDLRTKGFDYRQISALATERFGFEITIWRISRIFGYKSPKEKNREN